MAPVDMFNAATGKNAAIVMFWRDWASDAGAIDPSWLSAIAARGSVPMITWSPADWANGTDNANYTLANITNGKFDSYIRQTADILKGYGGPVLLRTMHEFNGNWYTHWSGDPAAYIAAWQHIHDIFTQEGATNVLWVWCPNTFWSGSLATDPSAYYPGNAYVDWVGLDGYNRSDWGYMSFSKIFGNAVNREAAYGKPLMIAETASGEFADGGVKKSQWISDAFSTAIPALPAIKAVLWFNEDKTASEGCPCDWSTNSSAAAQSALTSAAASPYYVARTK
jgi:beta-mannanase